jgi:hypothetical protein
MKKTLKLLPQPHAIARLGPGDPIPAWADGDGFVSISRSANELSVVCPEQRVPREVRQDREWSCLQLVGPFAFDETGVVLRVIRPLSEAGIGIFVVSTLDGDHILIKTADLEQARDLLTGAGYIIG